MSKYRLRFEKTGRAVYISHLDLMHTMQRAFSRSGCRLDYSEGFNPHPVISIALPLSVGCASLCEIMDFSGDKPDMERLNNSLPEGIKVLEIYESSRKVKELSYLEIEGEFFYDDGDVPDFEEFFSKEEIVVRKKTKRGESDTDIKPMIKSISFDGLKFKAVICAQNPTLNPEYLAKALGDKAPDYYRFTRIQTLDEDMKVFR